MIWMSQIIPDFILKTLNDLFQKKHKSHLEANLKFLTLIRKSDKDSYDNIKSFRPVSLVNILPKILDKIIFNRLIFLINRTPELQNCTNFAYKKHNSTFHSFQILYDALDIVSKNKIDEFLFLSLDYSSAFDSLSHSYLENFMAKVNFPSKIRGHFQQIFETEYAQIKNSNTPKFKIQSGISQGKCTSGILFCMMILPIHHLILK